VLLLCIGGDAERAQALPAEAESVRGARSFAEAAGIVRNEIAQPARP
jgi:hypothetical protein